MNRIRTLLAALIAAVLLSLASPAQAAPADGHFTKRACHGVYCIHVQFTPYGRHGQRASRFYVDWKTVVRSGVQKYGCIPEYRGEWAHNANVVVERPGTEPPRWRHHWSHLKCGRGRWYSLGGASANGRQGLEVHVTATVARWAGPDKRQTWKVRGCRMIPRCASIR